MGKDNTPTGNGKYPPDVPADDKQGEEAVSAHIYAAVAKAFEKQNGSSAAISVSNPSDKGRKTVFGFERTEVVKYVVGTLVAIAGFLFLWYQTVNKSLDDLKRSVNEHPTQKQLEMMFEKHSSKPHPGSTTEATVNELRKNLQAIEKNQIEIRADTKNLKEGIDEIKREMRRNRRHP